MNRNKKMNQLWKKRQPNNIIDLNKLYNSKNI